jgi:hypothetical protein
LIVRDIIRGRAKIHNGVLLNVIGNADSVFGGLLVKEREISNLIREVDEVDRWASLFNDRGDDILLERGTLLGHAL